MSVRLYWWNDKPNFGDAMSPFIVSQVLGTTIDRCEKWESNKLIGQGSVLWAIRYGDTIWGTGIHPDWMNCRTQAMPSLNILAVRGPHTRSFIERYRSCPNLFGDPATLLPLLYAPKPLGNPPFTISVSAVPHYDDIDDVPNGIHVIDPRENWMHVVDQIAASELILSSSLHGLIVAEAYDVPAVWIGGNCDELKFRDYYEGTDRTALPSKWRSEQAAVLPEKEIARKRLSRALIDWYRSARVGNSMEVAR